MAAGEGSRFSGKSHKLLADLSGRPVVWWAARHAALAGFDEVVVISGAVDLADVLPQEVTIIENHDWADGQSRSLQVAARYGDLVGHDVLVVGLGDQPLVPPQVWRDLGEAEGPIVTASFGGERRPPVRLEADVWPLLPLEGDEGARALMRLRPELVSEIVCEGNPADIDTIEDLTRVRKGEIPEDFGTWT